MKKIIYITISICILLTVISLLSIKWDLDIFMESTTPPPHDKVDLKLSIDNEIVFNDTLQRNPFSFPTHIKYPVRVGFHTISLSSKKANLQIEKEFFIFLIIILLCIMDMIQQIESLALISLKEQENSLMNDLLIKLWNIFTLFYI